MSTIVAIWHTFLLPCKVEALANRSFQHQLGGAGNDVGSRGIFRLEFASDGNGDLVFTRRKWLPLGIAKIRRPGPVAAIPGEGVLVGTFLDRCILLLWRRAQTVIERRIQLIFAVDAQEREKAAWPGGRAIARGGR